MLGMQKLKVILLWVKRELLKRILINLRKKGY